MKKNKYKTKMKDYLYVYKQTLYANPEKLLNIEKLFKM